MASPAPLMFGTPSMAGANKAQNANEAPVNKSTRPKNVGPTMPCTPDQYPHFDAYDEMIRVKVGEGDSVREFELYKGILKFYSGYFKTAIENIEKGRFVEAETGVICLPEEDPEDFAIFKSWMYSRDLESVLPIRDGSPLKLCKLWCFGDRRQVPLLQNTAVNALRRDMSTTLAVPTALQSPSALPAQCVDFVYKNTAEGSKLRDFIIYAFSRYEALLGSVKMRPTSTYWNQQWPKEALSELVVALMDGDDRHSHDGFRKLNLCKWHVHEEGVNCAEGNKPKVDETAAIANLCITNLSYSVSEEALIREFKPFAPLVDVRIIMDVDTNKSRGVGFVEFKESAAAANALNTKNGLSLEGRKISMSFSPPFQKSRTL